MEVAFSGTLNRVLDTKTFSSGSKKREFWATETIPPFKPGAKPFENKLAFEVFHKAGGTSDATEQLDQIPCGSIIKFSFSPRGNEWEGHDRVFVGLRVTSPITVVRNGPSQHQGRRTPAPATPPANAAASSAVDDMPF